MNDIFLSYAGRDREVAHELADALEALGWSVWWDREIPYGKPFDQVIEEELNAARCVIVLWTDESVASRWVKTEAAAAADRDRLVPVLLERVQIPFEFRRIQTAELYDWSGDRAHPEFVRVVESVKRMLGEPVTQPRGPSTALPRAGVPSSRWKKAGAAAIALGVLIVLGVWLAREPNAPPQTGSSPAQGLPPSVAQRTDPPTSASTKSAEERSGTASRSEGSEKTPPSASAQAPTSASAQTPSSASTQAPSSASTQASPGSSTQAPPAAGPFPIKIGDRIDDGVPHAGAGFIDTPGEKDVYTFTASARQRVYFRMLKYPRGMELMEWKLTDPEGRTIFHTRLGHTEPGVQLLRTAGTYRMTVGSDQVPATGAYTLQLIDVAPPQQFKVRIGDTIGENMPNPGAGVIERPGSMDVYVFTAEPGQRVYFRKVEHARGTELIDWRVVDADGTEVFTSKLGYGDPGAHVLRRGGTYTLEVGSSTVPATGSYRIQLTNPG